MEKINGNSIFNGVVIGKILFYSKDVRQIEKIRIDDDTAELSRYESAKDKAIEELNDIYIRAVRKVGELNAQVFKVHAMMLEDNEFYDSVRNIIKTEKVNAEYAVAVTGDDLSMMFSEMEDEYFRARAIDVADIAERVIAILTGTPTIADIGNEPVIIVTEDLAPSEIIQMDKEKLLAFVTRMGSANSHTAILARTMNIPSMIGVDIRKEWNGKLAIVDGFTGEFIIEPDDETIAAMKEKE